ncbi:MAG TPA: DapH/DapD/GlmU-related protein, partial [Candidatus Parcubacteria bacterium]|nr:DapH/DapD/GlmU-related protein [Candidatus Parcubacteria bacterium]
NKGKIVFLASKTDRPWEFGILDFKESGKILRVVENPKKGREPSKIKTNEVYLIPPNFLNYCKKVPLTEDSLIKAFNLFIKKEGAKAVVLKEETISLKYPWETLKALNFLLKSKHLKRKILSKSLGKNVILEGKVYIGKNVQIRENTVIKGPCYIGDNCQIGSNNLVRGSVNLEKGVVTGSFAEIKNSLFQENSHIHSGYFGNLILGRNCRFGAGFISANRRLDREEIKSMVKGKKIGTGLTYFGGVIGDNSYFGIRVSLMPGVLVGSGCKIGPNSLILENIPDKTTFYNKFYKG